MEGRVRQPTQARTNRQRSNVMQDNKPNKARKQQRAKTTRLAVGIAHIVTRGRDQKPALCGRWTDHTRPAPIPSRPRSGRVKPKRNLKRRAAARAARSRRSDRI